MSDEQTSVESEHYIALFDRHGVVGIYTQNAHSERFEHAQNEHFEPDLPTIAFKFVDKPGCEFIYVIPLNDSPAPAYITSDPEKATLARDLYASVGWTCDDDIDYWKYPVGEMCEPAKRRRARVAQESLKDTHLSAEEISDVLTKIEDAEQAVADNAERATTYQLGSAAENSAPVDIVALIGPSATPKKTEGTQDTDAVTPP